MTMRKDDKGVYCTERAPERPPIVTATDLLRAALKARNTAAIAKELQVAAETLNAFVAGHGNLSPTLKQQLTSEIFGGAAVYNEELDRLQPSNQAEATSISATPPRFVPPKVKYVVGGMNGQAHKPVLQKGEKPAPVPMGKPTRAGWA